MQKSTSQSEKLFLQQLAVIIDRFLPVGTETQHPRSAEEELLTELLQLAVVPFKSESNHVWGTIHLLDRWRTKLELKACHGSPPFDEPAECDLQNDKCVISHVALQRQPVRVANFDESPEFQQSQVKGVKSQLSVPVNLQGETIGVLSLQSANSNAFASSSVQYLTRVASFAALILERIQNRQIAEERGYYLNAFYALKKKEMLGNPVVRTEEDIRKLMESTETIEQVLEEMAKDA